MSCYCGKVEMATIMVCNDVMLSKELGKFLKFGYVRMLRYCVKGGYGYVEGT